MRSDTVAVFHSLRRSRKEGGGGSIYKFVFFPLDSLVLSVNLTKDASNQLRPRHPPPPGPALGACRVPMRGAPLPPAAGIRNPESGSTAAPPFFPPTPLPWPRAHPPHPRPLSFALPRALPFLLLLLLFTVVPPPSRSAFHVATAISVPVPFVCRFMSRFPSHMPMVSNSRHIHARTIQNWNLTPARLPAAT